MNIEQEVLDYINEAKLAGGQRSETQNRIILNHLNKLTAHHLENCQDYSNVIKSIHHSLQISELALATRIEDVPYVPVGIFKNKRITSICEESIYKVMYSSGTTGSPSQIVLSREAARQQLLVLSSLFEAFLGLRRPNILIIDNPKTLSRHSPYTARKAGIVGFAQLCRKRSFALDDDNRIDISSISDFLSASTGHILIYGFTSFIWQNFLTQKVPSHIKEELSDRAVLLHGGGWKKIEALKVSRENFNDKVKQVLGVKKIHNYYGMVEQTGSIFFECSHGIMHPNQFTKLIVRDPRTLLPIKGSDEPGIVQVLSVLPTSYPGHSLLTEDLAVVNPDGRCPCGRYGSGFRILGRIPASEVRGCSDSY